MERASHDRMERAIDRLRASGIVGEDGLSGCSDPQLAEVERAAGGSLPAAYVLFLAELGESAGDFLRGDDIYYHDMLGLTDAARTALAEHGASATLTEREFVFAGHHDTAYLYFDSAAGPDPPVYRYVVGDDETERVFETFSEWFAASVDDELSLADY